MGIMFPAIGTLAGRAASGYGDRHIGSSREEAPGRIVPTGPLPLLSDLDPKTTIIGTEVIHSSAREASS